MGIEFSAASSNQISVKLWCQVDGTSKMLQCPEGTTVLKFIQTNGSQYLHKKIVPLLNGEACAAEDILEHGDSVSLMLKDVGGGC